MGHFEEAQTLKKRDPYLSTRRKSSKEFPELKEVVCFSGLPLHGSSFMKLCKSSQSYPNRALLGPFPNFPGAPGGVAGAGYTASNQHALYIVQYTESAATKDTG